MKAMFGMAVVAAALTLSGPAVVAAEGAPRAKSQAGSDATGVSAYRRDYRFGYRSYSRPYYRPYTPVYYYARPVYYRPYPYSVPAPFVFGIGYGPWW
ncbi:hypothetical protein JQ628_28605 [Bradyrhizobium lablabi]|uniref:hypothetical protein n=1 Tax=Bradyrhizobium lablabi TaxID=722472 RepID=UPI001BACB58B|nr:hypothetical protein [Bradyrhizobium lablabi]MBR1125513.1 hypothetical protein [Bradyrhizobium lablabi]